MGDSSVGDTGDRNSDEVQSLVGSRYNRVYLGPKPGWDHGPTLGTEVRDPVLRVCLPGSERSQSDQGHRDERSGRGR